MPIHIFAKVEGKLQRWDAADLPYDEAISLVRDEVGLKTTVLALIQPSEEQLKETAA